MKLKRVSPEEYFEKRSLSAHDGKLYRAANMGKTFDPEARTCTFIMTDETPDSYGDIVIAKGADLSRFDNNPIALRNHRSDQPIGKWSDVKTIGKRVEGMLTLGKAGTTSLIDETYRLMEQRILRAASIGFMPIEIEMMKDADGRALYEYIIHTWEMYECSVVSVPANPNALAKAMKDGDSHCRDLIEEVLDTYVKTKSGLIVSREDFEKAHKEGEGDKTVLTFDKSWLATLIKSAVADALKDAGVESTEEVEPAPDPLIVELEKSMDDFSAKLDDIPEEEAERKTMLRSLVDGVKALFAPAKPPIEEKKTDEPPAPPAPPELATEEEKNSLRERLLKVDPALAA